MRPDMFKTRNNIISRFEVQCLPNMNYNCYILPLCFLNCKNDIPIIISITKQLTISRVIV